LYRYWAAARPGMFNNRMIQASGRELKQNFATSINEGVLDKNIFLLLGCYVFDKTMIKFKYKKIYEFS
jgi:hypothetical protein